LATVRQLPRILENSKSRQVFLKAGAQEAMKVLDVPTPDEALKDATLDQLAREINKRILGMSYSELQRLRANPASEEASVLAETRDQLAQLCSDIASEEQ